MPDRPRHAVLITRPAAEAEATAIRLQALGWSPVLAPLLHIHPEYPAWPSHLDALVVTSGNALASLTALRHLPVFTVGDATARRAAEFGFHPVQSASGDAADLASLIQTTLPPGATLALPAAKGEGLALMNRLRAHGFDVHRRVAYRVDQVHELPQTAIDALEAGTLHAALFLSARTAAAFVGLMPPALHPALPGIQAIAIGQPAADRLAPLPWGPGPCVISPDFGPGAGAAMTDETLPTPPTPTSVPPTSPAPSERARIEPSPPPKRLDALPVLYLVGFVILAASLIYLWKHPGLPRGAALEVARMDTVRQQLNTIQGRVDQLEARPAAPAPNLAPLESRLAALEQRPVPDTKFLETRLAAVEGRPALTTDLGPIQRQLAQLEAKPPVDLGPLDGRIAALEAKPPVDLAPIGARIAALEAKPPVDLAPLQSRIAAQEAKPPVDLAPLQARLDATARQAADETAALAKRLDGLDAQLKQTTAALAATTEKAQRAGKLQVASAALAAGQPLGDIPGAPPALARFAQSAPPTEAALRLGFDKAADAAQQASLPATTQDQPLLNRMWTKAQQSVTVRQGDHVLVGDPIAGVLASARQSLDAGDLAGAVKTLDAMQGPPKAAMAAWLGSAHALLDARAAIGDLAARG